MQLAILKPLIKIKIIHNKNFFHTNRPTKSDSDMTDKANKNGQKLENGTEIAPQIVNDDQEAQ